MATPVKVKEQQTISLPPPDSLVASAFLGGKFLLTSAGVAGILVGTGYLADVASQDLLGYQFTDGGSSGRYLGLAGQFIVDSFEVLFTWVMSNPGLTAVVVAAIGVWVLISTTLELSRGRVLPLGPFMRIVPVRGASQRERRVLRVGDILPHTRTRIVVLGMTLCAILVFLDFPPLRVNDMLVTTTHNGENISESTWVGSLSHRLFTDHVCSRVSEKQYPKLPSSIRCGSARAEHFRDLRGFYLLNFASTLLGIAALASLFRKHFQQGSIATPASRPITYLWRFLGPAVVVVAVLDVAALPYTYAKTVRSTLVNHVVADLDMAAGDDGAVPSPVPPPDSGAASVAPKRTVTGFLLDRSSDEIVLFDAENDEILVVPRSSVSLLHVGQKYDVLTKHLLANLPPE